MLSPCYVLRAITMLRATCYPHAMLQAIATPCYALSPCYVLHVEEMLSYGYVTRTRRGRAADAKEHGAANRALNNALLSEGR